MSRKKELSKKFKLSDIQVNAILEIRLRQLAKLEQIKIETEQNKLSEEQSEIEKILASKSRLKTLIKNELIEIKQEFGEERKSPIIESSSAKVFQKRKLLLLSQLQLCFPRLAGLGLQKDMR